MIAFLAEQPATERERVMQLMQGEAVEMALMLSLDFLTGPLRLSNRNVTFRDPKWGHEWTNGAGLLVALPQIAAGEGELAPFREYQLGLPLEWITADSWRADVVGAIRDVANYRGRAAALLGQLFDPVSRAPVGHPFTFDTGIMDRMTVQFSPAGAVVSLTVESLFARKGAPVYGMLTYADQQRRFPDDEGLQFTTEAGRVIEWTDW